MLKKNSIDYLDSLIRLMQMLLVILVLAFIITSCVDSYWPKVDKYEGLLVVDGLLTNGNDTITVKLSSTSSINDIEYIPVSGGEVYITDENKRETPLTETKPGTYIVPDNSFSGQIGSLYQLHINLPNGKTYVSDTCRLLPPSPIDSVYGIVESFEVANDIRGLHGIQFYVDFHNDQPDKYNLLWRLSGTYKYEATMDIDYTYEGSFIPYPDPDSLRTCWRTTQINDIFIFTNKYLEGSAVTRFPLAFISSKTKTLSIRYSLLVNQLTVSEEAFDFWNSLKEQNIDQGNLYTQQPIQIKGNMHNLENSDEPVLGYFTVAGISKKRIYVNRPPVPFFYNLCTPDFDLRFIAFTPESSWPIYIDDIMFLGYAMGPANDCFDCRLDGGSLERPQFWEDY